MHGTFRSLFTSAALAVALLPGCNAPTRTAGTNKLKHEQLALVRVLRHGGLTTWDGRPIHVETFYVGDAEYPVTRDCVFLLPPGRQKLAVDYGPCSHVNRPDALDDEDTGVFTGPFGLFEETLAAGTEYTITADPTLVGRNAVQTRHGLRVVGAEGARPK